jgi:hypothetical protein
MSLSKLQAILESPCPFIPGSKVKDTHYLFCVPSKHNEKNLTVMEWYRIHISRCPGTMCSVHDRFWYDELYFANTETARFEWFLMFEGVVPDSCGKKWEELQGLIPDGYYIPRLVEVLSMCILFDCKNERQVNEKGINGRTSSVYGSDNKRIVDFNCDIFGGFGINQSCAFAEEPGIYLCRIFHDRTISPTN